VQPAGQGNNLCCSVLYVQRVARTTSSGHDATGHQGLHLLREARVTRRGLRLLDHQDEVFFFILVTWVSRQITSRTLTLCASGLAYTPHHTCRQDTAQPTHAHAPTPKQAVRANGQPSQPRWRAELHSNLRRGSGAPPGAGCTKGGPVKATPQARCCPPGVVGSLW
jgi:hypothetical protein